MIVIQDRDVRDVGLTASDFVNGVRYCFLHKPDTQLPAKISVHPKGLDFITSMPCLLPKEMGRFNIKVVSRIEGRAPSLKSDSLLFDATRGEMLALIDTDYITTMRTGAVAALAVETFKPSHVSNIAMLGLGNTARATLRCLQSTLGGGCKINLLRYKDQAERFIDQFNDVDTFSFSICDEVSQLVKDADVIISCVTEKKGLFCEDVKSFKPGCLVVPVHTRGFQNCDIAFEKVFCDDVEHVRGFRYFSHFNSLAEIGEVLRGEKVGRESDEERIISYNIGLGLHDAYFCSLVYDKVKSVGIVENIDLKHSTEKYII